jgi:hypothetical protein
MWYVCFGCSEKDSPWAFQLFEGLIAVEVGFAEAPGFFGLGDAVANPKGRFVWRGVDDALGFFALDECFHDPRTQGCIVDWISRIFSIFLKANLYCQTLRRLNLENE